MPTREQIKKLLSNPKAQDRFIDVLDELLEMTKKPATQHCPPGLPPIFCKQSIKGGIPKVDEY